MSCCYPPGLKISRAFPIVDARPREERAPVVFEPTLSLAFQSHSRSSSAPKPVNVIGNLRIDTRRARDQSQEVPVSTFQYATKIFLELKFKELSFCGWSEEKIFSFAQAAYRFGGVGLFKSREVHEKILLALHHPKPFKRGLSESSMRRVKGGIEKFIGRKPAGYVLFDEIERAILSVQDVYIQKIFECLKCTPSRDEIKERVKAWSCFHVLQVFRRTLIQVYHPHSF